MLEERLYKILKEECNMQVTTDSRNCPKGSMFIALKGDKFNGNKFAQQAIDNGCAYALVDEDGYATSERIIRVYDCLTVLQRLAIDNHRATRCNVLAITGTNGKTTTKELIAAVLKKKYKIIYTEGNLNNHIGVPLTMLRIRPEHDIAVIEMGANHPGEIKQLARIAEPTYGLITNVGKAHLEGFGSFEKLVQTKCELYDYLAHDIHSWAVFVDYENEILMKAARARFYFPETYGTSKYANTQGELIDSNPYMRFKVIDKKTFNETVIQTQLVGAYNFKNALAAVRVGQYFNIPIEDIAAAISEYKPTNNRSQLTKTKSNSLIVDTYNANPTSMTASLENFSQMTASNKMVILGDMRELGASSAEEHQNIVDFLKEHDINDVWLVGNEFSKTNCDFRKFADVTAVKETLKAEPQTGKTILIKGSNSMRLFELPELL